VPVQELRCVVPKGEELRAADLAWLPALSGLKALSVQVGSERGGQQVGGGGAHLVAWSIA
jgi:hypothetical protein